MIFSWIMVYVDIELRKLNRVVLVVVNVFYLSKEILDLKV